MIRRFPVFERWVLGGVVLVATHGEVPLRLDGTAADLWSRLDNPILVDDLVAQMAADYNTDPAHIRFDIDAALRDLATAGVIEVAGV